MPARIPSPYLSKTIWLTLVPTVSTTIADRSFGALEWRPTPFSPGTPLPKENLLPCWGVIASERRRRLYPKARSHVGGGWIEAVLERRRPKVAIAVANKLARIAWAMMTTGEFYRLKLAA